MDNKKANKGDIHNYIDNDKFWCFNRLQDAERITNQEIVWKGPFAWPTFSNEQALEILPDVCGVYLFTFNYKDGYILRSAGITTSTKRRFYQHKRAYMKGEYTVLDVNKAQSGIRREIWHGWQYAKKHPEEFMENKDAILKAVADELSAYRLFVAEVDDRRMQERIESGIMQSVYCSKKPSSDLADHGSALRGRANNEIPINLHNIIGCKAPIYGLPDIIEI